MSLTLSAQYRTHESTHVTASLVGKEVTLAGWVERRRDHGGVIFVDLRDRLGTVQIVFRGDHVLAQAHKLRNEYCIKVTGVVEQRPEGNENTQILNGTVEVNVSQLEVLSESAPLPFQLDDEPGEDVRLKYRYLDLRRPSAAQALKLRSIANQSARSVLLKNGFLEIETPTLTLSTPEGARDFIVPARLSPGNFYALPQSPQLFKQLLMASGFERYFQFARCYRDEDFRADRQPEFTQLDIEASFVSQDNIIELAENILTAVWKHTVGFEIVTPIPRIPFAEAMARYGSDKPDLRFGFELVDCTEYFKDTSFRVFQAPYVGAVVMPGGASQPRRALDAWQEWAKQRGARGLAYVLVSESGELTGPVAKNLSAPELEGLASHVGAVPGDCIFFAAGEQESMQTLLGAVRVEIAHRLDAVNPYQYAFAWIVDFPMYEPADDAVKSGDVAVGTGAYTARHHAFTAPQDTSNFDKHPEDALAIAYDIVCNGFEIGGGSLRIFQRDVQERAFQVMGIDPQQAQERFGFFLEGLNYGTPPHGGIAFGWDRIIAILAAKPSIRDVIAFPKSGSGIDPLTNAPGSITPQQRKEAGLDFKPKKAE